MYLVNKDYYYLVKGFFLRQFRKNVVALYSNYVNISNAYRHNNCGQWHN